MELLADRDPEEARGILDPVLKHMMDAVHRYEGTVNQVMGDGIMALFGAPLAHESHAVRACYAALRIQESMAGLSASIQRKHGVPILVRVGLNSGRSGGAVGRQRFAHGLQRGGQTTHLAARMGADGAPGRSRLCGLPARGEGYVQARPIGPVQVAGLSSAVEVYEITAASHRPRAPAGRPKPTA